MDIFIFLLVAGIVIWGIIRFYPIVMKDDSQPAQRRPKTNTFQPEQMDQGDYHSGPHGYSPNTAYPETQYGSIFDEEADWNEEER